MKDLLIDCEAQDIVDVLRIYSVLGKNSLNQKHHEPKLFASDETMPVL